MSNYPKFDQNQYNQYNRGYNNSGYNNNGYNNYNAYQQHPMTSGVDALASQALKRVYLKMTLGLLVTAIVALLGNIQGFVTYMAQHSLVAWVLLGLELILVFAISGAINKMSNGLASLLFYAFAVVNGLMLSSIFAVYSIGSIALTFFITAGTFGAMSLYGYFTDRDLTKMGSILFMALIGLIIATVVNIFLDSRTMNWIISFAGVLIFVGLTAWDTQTIKRMCQMASPDQVGRIATIGALSLYLDFINLFLYLLRFFGSSRN